ncbi:hypothetical protein Mapa_005183 [Marchantia paleacea]|nr:hypothetical protein Mapa_005183 [Marchantia paleacea]
MSTTQQFSGRNHTVILTRHHCFAAAQNLFQNASFHQSRHSSYRDPRWRTSPEVAACLVGLAVLPIGVGYIVEHHRLPISQNHTERQVLARQIDRTLPILTPVSVHVIPIGSRTSDIQSVNSSPATHIVHEDQIPERISNHGEPYSSFLPTGHPAVIISE